MFYRVSDSGKVGSHQHIISLDSYYTSLAGNVVGSGAIHYDSYKDRDIYRTQSHNRYYRLPPLLSSIVLTIPNLQHSRDDLNSVVLLSGHVRRI